MKTVWCSSNKTKKKKKKKINNKNKNGEISDFY
jgi:hypothetical protein